MSNKPKGYVAEDFTHVTPALLARIDAVVEDQAARRYSSSAIYKAHNELFKLRETQQTCDTCLVIRATAIKKWKEWHDGVTPAEAPQIQIPVQNVGQGDPVLVTGGAPDSMPVADPITGEPTGQTEVPADVAKDVAIVNPTTTAERDAAALEAGAQSMPGGAAELNIPAVGEQATQADGTVIKNVGPVVGVQSIVAQIILQKINKDTYATEGDPLYGTFTASADDATKGSVLNTETGKALAPGTYATEDITKVLAVSLGGKATYRDVPTT